MSGYTKGPWECQRAKRPDNTGGHDYAIVSGGKIIAEAFEHVGYTDGRAGCDVRPVAANARLIAAAPDLLEALEMVWDAYGFDPSIDSGIWQSVLAAIAKARPSQSGDA